jgi:protein O-GlcNAc transferase
MAIWATQQGIGRAQQLQQAGKFAEAEAACRQLLASAPRNIDAMHLLGVLLSQQKRHEEAIAKLNEVNKLSPKNHVFMTNLGAAYAAHKEFTKASDCFRDAIAIKPSVPESHYNLANALKDLGLYGDAIVSYRKALQLKSNYPAAWNNLGAMYTQIGLLSEANNAINRALSLKTDYPPAHNNLANVQLLQGKVSESIDSCLRALSLKSDYVDAYRSMGMALISSRQFADAIAAFEKAIQVGTDSVGGYIELARAQMLCNYYDGVFVSLQKILAFEPDHPDALKLLGIVQMERGYYAQADAAFTRLIEIAPHLALKIRSALALPPILSSAEEITQLRKKINTQLDALANDDGVITDPYNQQIGPNFFLAYHALNDRDIQMKIARLYEKACPSLRFISPHCETKKANNGKIRVGFVSKYIYKHSVAISFGRVVEQLSQNADLELYLISTTNHEHEDVQKMYPSFQGAFVTIPHDLVRAQYCISVLSLDTLIYLDLGMEPLTFLLAFARLAPVQCVMGGHPVTTGIPNMDYYLSPADAEPDNGDEHYSEKLVRLKSGGFYFARPKTVTHTKSRVELGLPETGNIYLCPMMLQKIHPDFDHIIKDILARDTNGYVVLFESPQHARWNTLLSERLDRAVPKPLRERLLFHSWIIDPADFATTISHSSVVIDPVHFGIGSTAIPVFSVGTPIVTWAGEFMRGRVGFAYCRMLDTMECVAENFDDYANKAVNIANSPTLRDELKQKILANNHVIFENEGASLELAEYIRHANAANNQAG